MIQSVSLCPLFCLMLDTEAEHLFLGKLLMKTFYLAQEFQGQMETIVPGKVISLRTCTAVIFLHSIVFLCSYIKANASTNFFVFISQSRGQRGLRTSFSPLCLFGGPDMEPSLCSLILQQMAGREEVEPSEKCALVQRFPSPPKEGGSEHKQRKSPTVRH